MSEFLGSTPVLLLTAASCLSEPGVHDLTAPITEGICSVNQQRGAFCLSHKDFNFVLKATNCVNLDFRFIHCPGMKLLK